MVDGTAFIVKPRVTKDQIYVVHQLPWFLVHPGVHLVHDGAKVHGSADDLKVVLMGGGREEGFAVFVLVSL